MRNVLSPLVSFLSTRRSLSYQICSVFLLYELVIPPSLDFCIHLRKSPCLLFCRLWVSLLCLPTSFGFFIIFLKAAFAHCLFVVRCLYCLSAICFLYCLAAALSFRRSLSLLSLRASLDLLSRRRLISVFTSGRLLDFLIIFSKPVSFAHCLSAARLDVCFPAARLGYCFFAARFRYCVSESRLVFFYYGSEACSVCAMSFRRTFLRSP